jgi:hypothetical protein
MRNHYLAAYGPLGLFGARPGGGQQSGSRAGAGASSPGLPLEDWPVPALALGEPSPGRYAGTGEDSPDPP